MKHFMVKAAGVALSAVLMLGASGQVFASEVGDTEFNSSFTIEAHRQSRYSTWAYTPDQQTFTPSDSGCYFVRTDSQDAYSKTVTIIDSNGNVITSGTTDGTTGSFAVVLEAGVEYQICASANEFVRNSQAHDGSTQYTVSMVYGYQGCPSPVYDYTAPEGLLDDHCPTLPADEFLLGEPLFFECDIGTAPEIDAVIDEDVVVETVLPEIPALPALSAEDIKTMSVRNFVGHMYLECLGRTATDEEMANYIDMLQNRGVTASTIAASMLTSKEFEDKNVSNEEFVAILTNVFGDGISSDVALAALESGNSRSAVIHQFEGTQQWASRCAFYQVNV